MLEGPVLYAGNVRWRGECDGYGGVMSSKLLFCKEKDGWMEFLYSEVAANCTGDHPCWRWAARRNWSVRSVTPRRRAACWRFPPVSSTAMRMAVSSATRLILLSPTP